MKTSISQLNKNLQGKNSILIHGNCYAEIKELSLQVIRQINYQNDYIVINMDFIKVNREPEILFLELNNLSIFAKKKIIVLSNASNIITKELQNILIKNIKNNFIIVLSHELLSKSTLKDHYENSQKALSLAYYQDDIQNIKHSVSQYFKKYEVHYEDSLLAYLCNHLKNNSSELSSQVEKLLLYLGDKKQISYEDVDNIIFSETINPMINNLCIMVADGNIEQFCKLSHSMLNNKLTPAYLIRSIMRYFFNLEKILRIMKIENDFGKALKTIQPPIFFKLLPTVKRHYLTFSYKKIILILKKMLELELIIKKHDYCQKTIFEYHLIKIMAIIKN